MFYQKCTRVLLVVLLLLMPITVNTQYRRRIATGVWGGPHISIQIGEKSATVEYDCASGVIQGPLVMNRNGHFNLRGTHKPEHGGPVRADENPKQLPATFTGFIKGNTMTLTLKLADSDAQTFTLEKGQEGELFKCK